MKTAATILVLTMWCALAPRVASAANDPHCVAWGLEKPDQLHCFWVADKPGNLWHKGWWDGAWHTWQNMGRPKGVSFTNITPNCIAWGLSKPDQLHCFIEGDDFHLWHLGWWDGSWHAWQDLGAPSPPELARSEASCVAWGPVKPDQIHCFVRGPEEKLFHKGWSNGAWQPWEDMGHPPGKAVDSRGPNCLAWGTQKPDQLHCFIMAADKDDVYGVSNRLWHKGFWDGAWHSWEDMGKPLNTSFEISEPKCLAWGLAKPNQLHCFVTTNGSAAHLWHLWWADGAWSGWQDLAAPPIDVSHATFGAHSCVAWGLSKPDQLHCFLDAHESLWQRGWWDGAWHAWQDHGGPGWSGVNCLAWGVKKPDQLHCFALGTTGGYFGRLWHVGWWDGKWQSWQDLGHP